MQQTLYKIWSIIAVLIPTLVGLAFILSAATIIPAGTTAVDLARTVGFRNIALAIPTLIALFQKKWQIVGYLLLARGFSEFGDTASLIWAKGSFAPADSGTFVVGLISLAAGYVLIKNTKKTEAK